MNKTYQKGVIYTRNDGSKLIRKSIRIFGKKRSAYFSRKTDADIWYAEMRREKELLQNGMKLPLSPKTFDEFSGEWLRLRKTKNPRSTWKTEEERLQGYIVPFFSGRFMHQISEVDWGTYLDNLVIKDGKTPATRNRYRTLIHKMYHDAIKKRYVSANPISQIEVWDEGQDTFDYFETVAECQKYLDQAFRTHDSSYIFAAMALNTGMRLGEILALRNKDVDLEHRQIHVRSTTEYASKSVVERTKGKRDRWVPIGDCLHEILKNHMERARHHRPNDLLICYEDGSLFSESTLRKRHIRICEVAGLKKIRLHDLRHTFGSHFMMNGGDIYDLKEILGHADIKTTMRYAHLGRKHLQSKANVVSFALSVGESPTEVPISKLALVTSSVGQ